MDAEDGLFNPASVAFGTEDGDQENLYITNYAAIEAGLKITWDQPKKSFIH